MRVCAGIVVVPLVAAPVTPGGTVAVQEMAAPAVVLVSVTGVLAVLEQIAWLPCENCTDGAGFTMIWKDTVDPSQPSKDGVTLMVAVTGKVPLFIAVKEGIFPVPPAARPMDGVLFTHVYTLAGLLPVKVTASVASPLQTVCGGVASTYGNGFTVTVTVNGAPPQFAVAGVTVYVAVAGPSTRLVSDWLMAACGVACAKPPVMAPGGLITGALQV